MDMTYGALVLAGGNAQRMAGANKALLQWERRTFLSRLEEALQGFDEKFLSTRDPALAEHTAFRPILDRVPGRGPLEGLCCALSACRSDALLVVACDMPLFSAGLAQALIDAAPGLDALVCRDRTGRIHPLCGVYTKACLPVVERLLETGDLRVRQVLEQTHSGTLDLGDTAFPDTVLTNVNTPEQLHALLRGEPRT